MTVRVKGMKELKKQLDRLKTGTAKAVLRRAGIKAMKPMAEIARGLALKDTEALANSITVGVAAKDEEVGRLAFARTMSGGGSQSEALAAMRSARREARGQRGDHYEPRHLSGSRSSS